MKLEKFVPQVDLSQRLGTRVDAKTKLKYAHNDADSSITQTVKNLELITKATVTTNRFTRTSQVNLKLNEGDVLLFDEARGYFLPETSWYKAEDAIAELEVLKD